MDVYVTLMVGVAGEKVFDNYILMVKCKDFYHLPLQEVRAGQTLSSTADFLLEEFANLDPSWESCKPRQIGIWESAENELYVCYSVIIPEKTQLLSIGLDWVKLNDIFKLKLYDGTLEQIKLILLRRI